MVNMLWKVGVSALALAVLVMPARGADAQKDLPGPIDSLSDLQDTAKMLFKLADENNDNLISQQEAIDVANSLVGAFFFRADKNGDGTVSKEELREARDMMLAQRPLLRVILTRARSNDPQAAQTARNAGQGILSVLDSNSDGQIQAAEVKQMVQTTVQSTFAAADTNRDGQLSPSELNAAMAGAAKSVVQAAFQQADTDGNGQISQAEFEKAVMEPVRTAFQVLDLNHDGQLSPEEAQTARQVVLRGIKSLNLPEAGNSPRRQIDSALGSPTRPAPPAAPGTPR